MRPAAAGGLHSKQHARGRPLPTSFDLIQLGLKLPLEIRPRATSVTTVDALHLREIGLDVTRSDIETVDRFNFY